VAQVIDKLLRDHKHFFVLLDLLQAQLKHLVQGEYTDYQILTDIMRYFVNQPDVYHHPHEDIIFNALKHNNINLADIIDELISEHTVMASASTTILDELKQIQGNAIFSRDEIVRRLEDFISGYRAHIEKEEATLFALADKTLDAADWKKIETEIGIIEDPLFGKSLDGEYRELYKMILAEDKESMDSLPGH
jgi:hemerythrin-like domain-containing protein